MKVHELLTTNNNQKIKTLSCDRNVYIIPNSLFLPIADSGDVSSIKDVARLELLADLRPTISSWIQYTSTSIIICSESTRWKLLRSMPNAKTHTDVRVRAVQLCKAGGLQEPLPLWYRLRSWGFLPGRSWAIGQRQSAGCPSTHVWTKLICIEPHTKEHQSDKRRRSSQDESQNTSSRDSLQPFYSFIYFWTVLTPAGTNHCVFSH